MLKELKMSDIIYYKNGEETFRISPPTAGTKCPETKLEVKKMTSNKEIELVKQEIKMLQSKLEFLEEIERHNAKPKMHLENEGEFGIVTYDDEIYYRLEYPTAIIWYKRKDRFANDMMLVLILDLEVHRLLEDLWNNEVITQKDTEPYCPDEPSYYDEVEFDLKEGTAPPEPTPTVFRQKLFDGIKSVFYDPDYERTHWKMKVNMAVDEVLTHFYDVIPNTKEIVDDFEKGWNSCLTSIDMCMEHTDD
jgi:hypothetical protein